MPRSSGCASSRSPKIYDLEVERVRGWVEGKRLRRVLVQAPDGLKAYLDPLLEILEDAGVEVYLSSSHAWGGCDLALGEARSVGADGIVHVGHHGPVRFDPPEDPRVLFVPGFARVDPVPAVERAVDILMAWGVRRVSLTAVVQHIKELERIRRVLAGSGIEVCVGRGEVCRQYKGLITGCDPGAAKVDGVDAHVVVAGGRFHAIGVALSVNEPVVGVDPYLSRAFTVEDEVRRIVARRLDDLTRALDARDALVLLSIKPGQHAPRLARRVAAALRGAGLRVRVATFDDVDECKLRNLGSFDLIVNTACPRLVTDDRGLFPAPVINPGEIKYILAGELSTYKKADVLNLSCEVCAWRR